MTLKHTPGPWNAVKNAFFHVRSLETNERVCRINDLTENPAANARLIAAAPEMLEALKVAEATMSHSGHDVGHFVTPALRQIRAAINKAEGQDE